jgi:serine/threonine protein phosphatase PrpC
MRRANNQDSSACLPAKTQERFWNRGHLFVVADGMGAHAAGELASQMATESIAMHYFRSQPSDSIEALRMAVTEANDEIHTRGKNNPEFHNMGTTASSLAILPAGAVVAHVGDSRVYRLRRDLLEQLTFDHSLVWEMEASGHSELHGLGPNIPRNVITRSLGPNASVDIDVEGPFPIEKGDRFLICSDGLTGLVEDAEIGTLIDCLPADLAVRVLVDLTNLRGGSDNTTVVIIAVEEDLCGLEGGGKPKRGRKDPLVNPVLLGSTISCIVCALILGVLQIWGPMIVSIVLGLIASTISLAQYIQNRKAIDLRPAAKGGKGPYRRYDAKPTREMYQRLGVTVQELRDAATDNNWMMDWHKVDRYQRQGNEALKANDPKKAIRFQAQAIIETMNQLREQNNRAANETAIDH